MLMMTPDFAATMWSGKAAWLAMKAERRLIDPGHCRKCLGDRKIEQVSGVQVTPSVVDQYVDVATVHRSPSGSGSSIILFLSNV